MSSDSLPDGSLTLAGTLDTATPSGAAALSQTRRPRVAVVPAAGFGSRLRPLTDAIPKEMLPLGRLTALERIVRELETAHIERIVIVVSPAKEALLRQAFQQTRLGIEIRFAVQPQMRGLGDALLQAAPQVFEAEPFLVALGDAVFEEAAPGAIVGRLIDAASAGDAVGIVVQKVPRPQVSRYGVIRPVVAGAGLPRFAFDAIVEKPAPDAAPSRYAAAARYLLPPSVFACLADVAPDAKGEVQLTPALQALLGQGVPGIAVPLARGEARHDLGNFDSYFRAFCKFALSDPEQGEFLGEWLMDTLRRRANGDADDATEGVED